MKMETLSYREYEQLKQSLEELGWVWQAYQRECPDGWYEFKYQTVLRHFIVNDVEEKLIAQVQRKRFPRCVKIPKGTYREMKELSEISLELQDVLAHPYSSFSAKG